MTKIIIKIKDCTECPDCDVQPYPTEDSWERAEVWYCNMLPDDEGKGKKIQGYIETFDKVKVPDWCPRRKNKKNK